MAHYTLIARVNAGDGKFPFVNVKFSKNYRPIPIEGATYFLRPSSRGKRTPIKIGKDVAAAYTALVRREELQPIECTARLHATPPPRIPTAAPRPDSARASGGAMCRERPQNGFRAERAAPICPAQPPRPSS